MKRSFFMMQNKTKKTLLVSKSLPCILLTNILFPMNKDLLNVYFGNR